MELDEMTVEDMVAMFAMLGLLAQGKGGSDVIDDAYRYADYFVATIQERAQENADE